ncbi:BMP-binding endothelial regulator protein-like [Haliotis asinina]|uniref:BMP-binding endothelial regulator protein-like n=1 Tax=Haliotis asinina TaxID=109174 RepID=UPI003531F251
MLCFVQEAFSNHRTTIPAIVTILLWIHLSPTVALLQGTVKQCSNEGEEINITGITTDPCIACFCRNGQVECEKTKCGNLEGCHAILFDGPSKKCCQVCKGCVYKGKSYESGQIWSDPKKPCEHFECRASVVTRSKKQCHVPCKNPIQSKNECCPSCKGCYYEGKEYKNGDIFSLKTDKCVSCSCNGGSITCTKKACPVLNCPAESVYTPEGECCPKCKGKRTIFDLRDLCYYARTVKRNGDTFSLSQQNCTTCTCSSGTTICTRQSCPPLDCPESEQIQSDGACCKKCLPKRDCTFQEKGYKHREEWRPSICTHCTCDDGVTYCQRERCSNSLWCPKGYRLKFEPGACCPKCVEQDAVCTVFGDPHYRTFDGKMYNFQGTCKYLLAKDCSKDNAFTIKVKNGVRLSSGFAWTQMLVVFMGNTRVSLLQNLVVKVNRKRISLPYSESNNKFTIRKDGHSVTFRADIGLKVVWDGDSYLEVTVSSKYKNQMCGLCGNYNGLENDDLVGRKGKIYEKGEDFGHSWRIGSKKACKVKPKLRRLTSPCESDARAKMRANRHCSALYDKTFAKCRRQVDVQPYVTSCVTDMCDCPQGHQCACESLRAYANECKRAGFKVKWDNSMCNGNTKCPNGAIFTPCASACPRTCSSKGKLGSCGKKCKPGCQCKKGTVLHNNRCIHPKQCPKKA